MCLSPDFHYYWRETWLGGGGGEGIVGGVGGIKGREGGNNREEKAWKGATYISICQVKHKNQTLIIWLFSLPNQREGKYGGRWCGGYD